MSELGRRTVSALIYGVVLILPLLLHPTGLVIVIMFMLVAANFEYYDLLKRNKMITGQLIVLIMVLMCTSIFLLVLYSFLIYDRRVLKLTSLIGGIYGLWLYWRMMGLKFPFPIPIINGIFYISLPLASIVCFGFLKDPYDPMLVLYILSCVWSFDVFAYFTGRWLGKHKIAPRISPNKSIEGFIGGVLISMVWGLVLGVIDPDQSGLFWMTITVIMSLAAFVGDLVESLFKRKLDLKDSGRLLPGHGGILDRIDSTLFAAPFGILTYLLLSTTVVI